MTVIVTVIVGKRQTSFAGVETWPVLQDQEAADLANLIIPDKDLEITTMRSGESVSVSQPVNA